MKAKYNVKTKYTVKGKRGSMERANVKAFGRVQSIPLSPTTIQYEEVRSSDNVLFELDILKKLYKIHSPSAKEDRLADYVAELLTECGLPFNRGPQGEIYSITKGLPLIAAHMDQVQTIPCTHTVQNKNFIYGMGGHRQAGLGADDKNGVWVALNLIKEFGTGINFLFSTMEEVGGMTNSFLKDIGETITNSIPYCVVFDRKGSSDIIGVLNEYCEQDFQDAVAEHGARFGYKSTMGIWSDCDHISNYIPCVNLSCGYYAPHTDYEYTNVNELINALDFGVHLFSKLRSTWFQRVKKQKPDFRSVFFSTKKDKDWEPAEYDAQEWDITGAQSRYPASHLEGSTYTEETLLPAFENEEYVESEYMQFDIVHGNDGFYLATPSEYVLLTDRTELQPGESIDITVSDTFSIVIDNDPAFGYDAWITDYGSFQGELTYRDGRN